jgi:hypothetical protein
MSDNHTDNTAHKGVTRVQVLPGLGYKGTVYSEDKLQWQARQYVSELDVRVQWVVSGVGIELPYALIR